MWRLEPETDPTEYPRILVQSRAIPNWTSIGVQGWLANANPAIDLKERLKLDSLKVGQRFRFRLRANPSVARKGKRLGLLQLVEQETWVKRKAQQHGFSLTRIRHLDLAESAEEQIDVRIAEEQMLRGNQRSGHSILIFSVLYDGILTVADVEKFRSTLQTGIGHGKVMGLGLLSVVPVV